MPFTFSHPAIVLPVHAVFRRWTSLTGLVIGSMAPDFEKFIRMSTLDPYSHTWRSIFYFNLPLGILLTFVYHLVVRDALLDNLPAFLSRRLIRFKNFDWVSYFRQNYMIVMISIMLGTASHIFWDSFTHVDGRAVRWLPFLLENINLFGHQDRLFGVLQIWSSVVGAFFLLAALLALPPAQRVPRRNILPYWLIVAAVASVVAFLRLWLRWHRPWDLIFIFIAATLVGLISAPLILRRLQNS